MTEKRFYTDGQYVMQKGEVWVVAGGEHSADVIAIALNELIEEINKLQFDYNMEVLTRQSIEKENKQLKQELFEARKDYLIETYSDNPTRRDEKIQGLKEEFKERFGDVE